MALLDRFRRPQTWKHEDPVVRLAAVEQLALDQQDLLASLARTDGDARVRQAAVRKVVDLGVVAEVARQDRDEGVREEAGGILRDVALGAFEGTKDSESLEAVGLVSDARDLVTIAETSPLESVRQAALGRIEDPRALALVARRSDQAATRLEALGRVTDPAEVCGVALKSGHKDVALAAVERTTDRDALRIIASKAVCKAAARRARTLLESLEAQAAPATSADPAAPVAGQDAPIRRLALCRQVESLGRLSDWRQAATRLAAAEAAWSEIGGEAGEELTGRFAMACDIVRDKVHKGEADEHAREALAEAVAAASTARAALCDAVSAIEVGEAARQKLEAVKAAWRELAPLPQGYEAQGHELARRFEDAWRACARRCDRWQASLELQQHAVELCRDADQTADVAAFPEAAGRWAAISRRWRDLLRTGLDDPALGARYAQAEVRFQAREAAMRAEQARERQVNADRLRRACDRADRALAAESPALKDAERSLREIREALENPPSLPTKADHDELEGRLKTLQAALVPKVQELREVDEWRRWANAGIQEELCRRAETLRGAVDLALAARELRVIQEEWKNVSLVPREQGQALWARFKAACDEVRARCETYFQQQALERAAHLERKEALCQQAEALADSTDWLKTAEAIKALQAEWKTIGPIAHGKEKALWERFRHACDRFFTRRHEDLVRRKEEWTTNLASKQALCERVEALEASTDWDKGIDDIRRAQAEWKAIGPVKKTRAEAIWQRFRSACDAFFERYRERDNATLAAERAAREAICAELEALAGPESPAASEPRADDLAAGVLRLRGRWRELGAWGSAPQSVSEAVTDRYVRAIERVLAVHPVAFQGTDLDPEISRRTMIELCERVEALQPAARVSASAEATPAAILARQLREALASNTIGGRAAAAETDARWKAAEEVVRTAKAAWSTLGPVPGDPGRMLARRFQQACHALARLREQQQRPISPPVTQGRPSRGSRTPPGPARQRPL